MRERPGSRRTPLIVTDFGDLVAWETERGERVEAMTLPHRCNGCGLVYDGGKVEVTARYADCSVWRCPGCRRTHDSRHAWSGGPGERMGYVDLQARDRAIAERRHKD